MRTTFLVRKTLIGFLLICSTQAAYTQTNNALSPTFPAVIPPTPEVSRIMEMINYPVSYNTGTVKTEIPIYEIKLSSGYVLPIKLVNQSSGFKPNERSVAGMGWSLVAEPQIAHAVNGLPDDGVDGLYINDGLNVNDTERYIDMAYGHYDYEPDQFFYQLPGKGGSFFTYRDHVDNARKGFVTVPYDPVRIEATPDMKRFYLTDIDGVSYSFKPVETTTTTTATKSTQTTSVFKAESIVTPHKEHIRFEYNYGKPSSSSPVPYIHSIGSYDQNVSLEIREYRPRVGVVTNSAVGYCSGLYEENNDDSNPSASAETYNDFKVKLVKTDFDRAQGRATTYHVLTGDGISPNVLRPLNCGSKNVENYWRQVAMGYYCTKITFPGGCVEFTYDYRAGSALSYASVLSGIKVKDEAGNIVTQCQLIIDMNYNRPRLNKLFFKAADGTVSDKYLFEYYGGASTDYDTPATNPWGYYSGNSQAVPRLKATFKHHDDRWGENVIKRIPFCYGGIDYYQDPYYYYNTSLRHMLKKVCYPTGGYSEFVYEPNKFFESSRNKEVGTGSLRIKEIADYQRDGVLSSRRTFKYGQNESGRGIPVRILKDSDFMTSY